MVTCGRSSTWETLWRCPGGERRRRWARVIRSWRCAWMAWTDRRATRFIVGRMCRLAINRSVRVESVARILVVETLGVHWLLRTPAIPDRCLRIWWVWCLTDRRLVVRLVGQECTRRCQSTWIGCRTQWNRKVHSYLTIFGLFGTMTFVIDRGINDDVEEIIKI